VPPRLYHVDVQLRTSTANTNDFRVVYHIIIAGGEAVNLA